MTARQRLVRGIATAVISVAIVTGIAIGDDEHFPFGPFRMYSTRNEPNGTVNVVKLVIETPDGDVSSLPVRRLGLRPAEVNGQITRFADDSLLARYLARSYRRFGGEVAELRVVRGIYQFRGGRPVSYREIVLGSWRDA